MKNFITVLSIISILIFVSCKKDNNNPLPEPALKKAILGKWNWIDTKIVYKNGSGPLVSACIRAPYSFLANDTCIFNTDTIPFKIIDNAHLVFDGNDCVEGHLYTVTIRNDTMQWDQIPPFYSYNISQYSYYFKRQP